MWAGICRREPDRFAGSVAVDFELFGRQLSGLLGGEPVFVEADGGLALEFKQEVLACFAAFAVEQLLVDALVDLVVATVALGAAVVDFDDLVAKARADGRRD